MILTVQEWDSDDRASAEHRPNEIARDADWTVTFSRTQDGFCIAHALGDGPFGYTTGRLPSPSGRSKHVVALIAAPAGRKEGVGLVAGLVMPNVARVEVQFRDGTSISARTDAAPDVLEADLRTFVIRTPFDEQPFGPDYPPFVREYVLLASNGAVLERLAFPRRSHRT